MQWGGHCIAFAQSKRIQAKKGNFFCNNIVVDPNAPTGQQQPAQGSALGKGHVRRTRWKCKSTTRCRCCSQCFCPCRALVCWIPLTQGDALGYERVGLSGRSLSERVNCDIISNPLTQSRFCLQRNRSRSGQLELYSALRSLNRDFVHCENVLNIGGRDIL